MREKTLKEKIKFLDYRDIAKIRNMHRCSVRRIIFRGQIPSEWTHDKHILKLLGSLQGGK